MEPMQLTDDLLTGIDEIDSQHRELFARGNGVLFPETEDVPVQEVLSALLFLLHYVEVHFKAEERLMAHYGYDRADGHRQQHLRLRREVMDLYRRTEKQGNFARLKNELYYLFGDWYIYHIREWDQHYAAFLQKRAKLDTIRIPAPDETDDGDIEFLESGDGLSQSQLETLRKLRRD